jgi:hypothetical protein
MYDGEAVCKITFDTAGTSVRTTTVTMYTGEILDILPNPVWSSYVFRGWFDGAENGAMVRIPYEVTKPATLYAYWYDAEGTTFDLYFDAGSSGQHGNGVQELRKTLAMPGSTVSDIPVPSNGSNAFLGWLYDTTENTTEEFTRLTTSESVAPVSGKRTLSADWANGFQDFTITFDALGGSYADGSGQTVVTIRAPDDTTVPGSYWPANPVREGFSFIRYMDALNDTAMEFTGDTKIWKDMTAYAVWNLVNAGLALRLRYDFSLVEDGSTSVVPVTGSGRAVVKGNYGETSPFGSKEIGDKTFYYYKTGPRMSMSADDVTYLDLGANVGDTLKGASYGYTMSVYIRADPDANRAANGCFVWTFSSKQALSNTGAMYFIANTSRNDNNTTLSSYSSEQRVRQNGVIKNGEWMHIAYTQDGKAGPDNAKLYINGAQVAAATITILPSDITAPLVFNTLGGPCYTGDANLPTTMFTDYRIYDAALTADQIAELAGDLGALNSVSW